MPTSRAKELNLILRIARMAVIEYHDYFLGDKGGRCVGLTTLPPSRADCLEIWELEPLGTLRACTGL